MDQTDLHDRFMRLFLSSQHEVLRYILALVPNADDAQEILQETAIALWAKFDDYDDSQRFEPWACRFALNKVKQHRRKASRSPLQLDDSVLDLIAVDYDRHAAALAAQREALTRCIAKLSEEDRSLVRLHYFQRVPIQQIAADSSQNIHTLYKAMQRIRRQLHRCVNHNMSAGALS
ncbi:MAG: RNA polymerase sigma-70 factor (ECF subfamily) [Rhodothermales bacterium]|jgi:RNA polymerase sigma-70 factor (ECF subfamily)